MYKRQLLSSGSEPVIEKFLIALTSEELVYILPEPTSAIAKKNLL